MNYTARERRAIRRITEDALVRVFTETGISEQDLRTRNRASKVADARQRVWAYSWLEGLSYKSIGYEWGRDHTTIMYGVKRFIANLPKNTKLNAQVKKRKQLDASSVKEKLDMMADIESKLAEPTAEVRPLWVNKEEFAVIQARQWLKPYERGDKQFQVFEVKIGQEKYQVAFQIELRNGKYQWKEVSSEWVM
jgi:hypothetical protein